MNDWDDFATHSVKRVRVTEEVDELHVLSGAATGTTIDLLDEPIIVGSREPANLVLADEHVSGLHCRFERRPEGIHIQDLGSRNGTWLGGHRIIEAILAPGGRVKLGATDLELVLATKQRIRNAWDGDERLGEMFGRSAAMQRAFAQIAKLFGVSRGTVARELERLTADLPDTPDHGRRVSRKVTSGQPIRAA